MVNKWYVEKLNECKTECTKYDEQVELFPPSLFHRLRSIFKRVKNILQQENHVNLNLV